VEYFLGLKREGNKLRLLLVFPRLGGLLNPLRGYKSSIYQHCCYAKIGEQSMRVTVNGVEARKIK